MTNMNMKSILDSKTRKGNELSPADQAHVLASFVHRFTKQHRPQWAGSLRPDGTAYPVQFASDADWLANTEFAVLPSGKLDRRVKECHSSPTWPDNP